MSEVEIIAKPPARFVGTAFSSLDITETTRDEYRARLGNFLKFVAMNGISAQSYLQYKQHLAGRVDIGVAAKNKYLVSAKAYLKELHRNGVLPVDITANVKTFKQSKKHKRNGLTQEEVERLTDWLHNEIDPTMPYNTRLRALVCLLLLQGLRQIEVSRLNWKDVDLRNGLLFVRGKGRDDKEPVYLHPQTSNALLAYLGTNDIIRTGTNGKEIDGPLFVSISNSSRGQRLNPKGIRAIIVPVLRTLGIQKSVHGFRHYFTTALIRHYEGHLLQVARYTRHRNLEMLQVYNDAIQFEADLPNYYQVFSGLDL